jgi:hypothetical protein
MDTSQVSIERASKVEACARAAHEVNRAYCLGIGDNSQLPWEQAPAWQRDSSIKGVLGVLNGNGPAESHASWLEEKLQTGWIYGPEKDPEKKTHPCMVPYAQLPAEQQMKDHLYVTVVQSMAIALDLPMRVKS